MGFIVYYAADRTVFSQQLSCPAQTRGKALGLVGYVNGVQHQIHTPAWGTTYRVLCDGRGGWKVQSTLPHGERLSTLKALLTKTLREAFREA